GPEADRRPAPAEAETNSLESRAAKSQRPGYFAPPALGYDPGTPTGVSRRGDHEEERRARPRGRDSGPSRGADGGRPFQDARADRLDRRGCSRRSAEDRTLRRHLERPRYADRRRQRGEGRRPADDRDRRDGLPPGPLPDRARPLDGRAAAGPGSDDAADRARTALAVGEDRDEPRAADPDRRALG